MWLVITIIELTPDPKALRKNYSFEDSIPYIFEYLGQQILTGRDNQTCELSGRMGLAYGKLISALF